MANKNISILLVEDNPADTFLVKEYLNDASLRYDLFHADALYEAIDKATSNEMDIALLDLTLPDSQGFKTLTSLLERVPNMPIVVLTGMNNEIVGNQAIKAGAQDYLIKGQFEGKLLGRSIRYAMQRHKDQIKKDEMLSQLRQSEKLYNEAQALGRFGNWYLDIITNNMSWTEEVFRILGLHNNSWQPSLSKYLEYVHHEDKAAVEAFFETAIRTGKEVVLEHRIVVKGSNLKYVALSACLQPDEFTGNYFLMGVIQNITDRKTSEKLLEEKNINKKTNKLRNDVIADLGFHIRTPISSIINFLYLLEKSNPNIPQQELVQGLKSSVDDLSILFNHLLNLSILGSENIQIEKEQILTESFMESIQKLVNLKATQSNCKIEFHVSSNLPDKITCDEKKIIQMMFNLLHTATSISAPDSTIQIVADVDTSKINDPRLIFSITHRGQGVSQKQLRQWMDIEQLWTSYTLDTNERNNQKINEIAIGISGKLCKMMSGTLHISVGKNESLNYTAEIPVDISKSIKYSNGETPKKAIRILLVEDHFLNQIATKKVLLAWSDLVTVDIAENGMVGVEKSRAYDYDLILMDIQMPVMNGLDATTRIREKSQIPIIALTANSSNKEREHCLMLGMNDYISKPFKPAELYTSILAMIKG